MTQCSFACRFCRIAVVALRFDRNRITWGGLPTQVIANQISALTVRSNYFEENWQDAGSFSFQDHGGVAVGAPCSDVIINGDQTGDQTGDRTTSDLSNSMTLSRFAAFAKKSDPPHASTPGPITLSNARPCNSVVLEANFHNPSGNPLQYCEHFFGAFAAGATGLRSESNHCADCKKWHGSYTGNNRTCVAVGTGLAPGANTNLSGFDIKLNTGDFAAMQ